MVSASSYRDLTELEIQTYEREEVVLIKQSVAQNGSGGKGGSVKASQNLFVRFQG